MCSTTGESNVTKHLKTLKMWIQLWMNVAAEEQTLLLLRHKLIHISCFLSSSGPELRLGPSDRGESYGSPEGPVHLQRLWSQHSLRQLHQGKLHGNQFPFDSVCYNRVSGSGHELRHRQRVKSGCRTLSSFSLTYCHFRLQESALF